jgi:hypothetical protein
MHNIHESSVELSDVENMETDVMEITRTLLFVIVIIIIILCLGV